MPPTFIRAYPPAQAVAGLAYWLPFLNDEVLVQHRTENQYDLALIHGGDEIRTLLQEQSWQPSLYIGTLNAIPCIASEVSPNFALPTEWKAHTLRTLYGRIADAAYSVAGYASQLLYWQHTSRFCPVCGHLTESLPGTWGRRCTNCGHIRYPLVTPAILALVHDGERILLAHKRGWGKRYSCVAGFVEPGESLEECVQREVYEELSVEVTDVSYVGSQPWPFPHQLMVGYTARYRGGQVRLDERELDGAQWFHVDQLPELPPPLSLAHHMITSWAQRFNKK